MQPRTATLALMALLALALAPPSGAEAQTLTQKEKTAVLSALNQQQNIAGWRGRLTLAALINAVNQWGSEARDYNIVRNTCAGEPNSIHHQWHKCAHYTQIVSAATTKVGCARSVCPNMTFPITIVCNFGNAGNVDHVTGTLNRPYELSAAGLSTGR